MEQNFFQIFYKTKQTCKISNKIVYTYKPGKKATYQLIGCQGNHFDEPVVDSLVSEVASSRGSPRGSTAAVFGDVEEEQAGRLHLSDPSGVISPVTLKNKKVNF